MVNGLQDFQLGQVITAIGGLGTAAFGLVDAAKSAFSGINRVGLKHIYEVVSELAPEGASAGGPVNALPQAKILESLEANWVNGNDLASQKAIAKSLIKLHLSSANSTTVAVKASVDPAVLTAVASKLVLDFPCKVEGEVLLLCWKLGETAIQHWHSTSEGFAGRKPIDTRIANAGKKRPK